MTLHLPFVDFMDIYVVLACLVFYDHPLFTQAPLLLSPELVVLITNVRHAQDQTKSCPSN